ncbi:MAG: hypothetical protein B9S32_02305 [Verrucomicrobia bacterium Tous-C9LFEB]|nr:MAG: hypothetical protein B9S32_02305 [Verrucomicrobia bacterium Tous-C9LFEB]
MRSQELIALAIVGVAVAYLLFRALRKGKPGCGCGSEGCCKPGAEKK